jgi:hypothetical protein
MNTMTMNQLSTPSTTRLAGIAAVTSVAYVLCDLLHEFGHATATLLPLGVRALSISTIGLSTSSSSAVVAAAGPLVNVALSLTLFLAASSALSSAWRYFAWLFGTVNLFNATAYFLYSAVLGSGDWAVVFNALASPSLWRPAVGLAGLGLYAGSIYASLLALRRLVAAGIIAESNVDRYCTSSYWLGGALITAGAVFNPENPWFILTSGAATGLAAMIGLLLLPPLLLRSSSNGGSMQESLRIGWVWVVAGAVAAVVFIGVFGPGVRLAA